MRLPIVRLVAFGVGIVAVLSCDAGPVSPRFGNGIAGGATGTAPVVPPAPGSPDTTDPFVLIRIPATDGQLINIGDSILVEVLLNDDRQLGGVSITGFKEAGDTSLGTFTRTVRYPTVTAPAAGSPFAVGQTSAIIRRYIRPAAPVDSTTDSLIIMAILSDGVGNVDTSRRRVQLVTGPAVTIVAPVPNDSVPQGVNIAFTVRVTSNAGVRTITMRAQGETTWPPASALDSNFTITIAGIVRDTTITRLVTVPPGAPVGGRITISAGAQDINGNPGSAPPITVFVRAFGTSAPRVTQVVPTRLETGDSITIFATGDGIASVGFRILDANGAILKDSSIAFTPPFTSNVTHNMRINLPVTTQGQAVRILSYATDQAGVQGFSVPSLSSPAQTNVVLAKTDSATIVYGLSYRLPRTGTVGDIAVDPGRNHVLVSNMNANRLEVWQNSVKAFDATGVAVGSQPWGLNVSIDPNVLLVANSGGTNISRVNLGTGTVASIQEDLNARIRTRTNFLHEHIEGFDAAGAVKYAGLKIKLFSDRPQYIGQLTNGTIFFSTRPTSQAPEGTVRYLDPTQPFPDLRTFVFVRSLLTTVDNFVLVDIDSVRVRPGGGTGIPDTLFLFDHLPGTNTPSVSVKSPTCRDQALGAFPGVDNCTAVPATSDPRFDPRFPGGLPQGTVSAALALRTYGACSPNCSDITVIEDASPVGITDTTFLALSSDRNWLAIGQGNSAPGLLMMANVNPSLNSPFITQVDLVNQAAERVLGVAIDSTGQTVAIHGTQSFFSAVDQPFHLRLQGIYADATSGGAGIAYHPRANGNTSSALPADERLAFIATGQRSIHAVDIAFFVNRGRFEVKHQLYGPLRVSRPMAGDDPSVILKLYGISLEGGLTVIDLRAADILPVP
jgi:hypothetical protein